MGEFDGIIDLLSEADLTSLEARNMGDLDLQGPVRQLRILRRDLEAAQALDYDDIPLSVRNEILGGNFRSQVMDLIEQMRDYGPTTDNPTAMRTDYGNRAESLKNLVIERVVPITRPDPTVVQETLTKAQETLVQADLARRAWEDAQAELTKQQAALAQTNAVSVAADLADQYKEQAQGHGTTARTFLYCSIGAAVLLTGLTVWLLFGAPPHYSTKDNSADQWIEVTRATVARLVVLSIAGFAVGFCARNYRVNMHLQVLNKRRENALNTFGRLQASVTSETARDIVVGELVRSVFTSEETGYLGAETERTVIESPGGAGLLTAVSAAGRGQGSV